MECLLLMATLELLMMLMKAVVCDFDCAQVQLPNGTIYPYAINGPGGIGVDVLSNFISSVSNVGIGHGFYYSFHDSYFLNVPQGGIVSPNPPLPGQPIIGILGI